MMHVSAARLVAEYVRYAVAKSTCATADIEEISKRDFSHISSGTIHRPASCIFTAAIRAARKQKEHCRAYPVQLRAESFHPFSSIRPNRSALRRTACH